MRYFWGIIPRSDDDKCIEQVKSDSWNNEKVHGGVIAQEGQPSLAGGGMLDNTAGSPPRFVPIACPR
jgi:hypothetical protein